MDAKALPKADKGASWGTPYEALSPLPYISLGEETPLHAHPLLPS